MGVVLLTGAMTCMKLECYGEALEWCDQGLRVREGAAGLVLADLLGIQGSSRGHCTAGPAFQGCEGEGKMGGGIEGAGRIVVGMILQKRQERDQRKMAMQAKAEKEERLKLVDAIKVGG